ncbi:MAG TPA: hypothetical protein VK645_13555 [Chitinophagaceae bacterium]|nr:hypothetical protein [Chitinophagaceae bacterium]
MRKEILLKENKMNIYENIQPVNKNAAEVIFSSGDTNDICHAMVSLAFHEQDWKWAQDKFLILLFNENSDISGLAAVCLGHLARIHRQLEKDKVVAALNTRLDDEKIAGQIRDALDDINIFLT